MTASVPSAARRRRRGVRMVLPVIAGLLVVSGLIRLGGGASRAIAESVESPPESVAEEPAFTTMNDDVLAALQSREQRLAAREAQLADRAAALNVAEAEIREQLAALAEAEASLSALLALSESAAENDLTRLTAVYESMKAAEAAALFATMDPAFSAGFLGRMRADVAAEILGQLDPATAYSISVILAGRNAAAPTE